MREHDQLEVREITSDKASVCREILSGLPEWFGWPGAVDGYVRSVPQLPMLGCQVAGGTVGFLSLKTHATYSLEVYVLGVKPEWHRKGVGRTLIGMAERRARDNGLGFLSVKTVADLDPSPDYARTRKFYAAMGFLPLEAFKTLFRSGDPCLLMVKPL
ncbi:MAG: GNAT family N-acetyltransferase [Proteobacteria bacterium]|nr:GNAT family N-acetyltransferase [Pseudomonadota bacterium]MBI3498884.1 GNAT family N-acetyltransferase [Pseudomonadota bacterium]